MPQISENDRLLSKADLKSKGIRFSDPTLYRKIKDGTFPRPCKIGANSNAWSEREIQLWIAERLAERGEAA